MIDDDISARLRCLCGGPVALRGGRLACRACGRGYPVSEGVADFSADFFARHPAIAAEAEQWDRQASEYESVRARDPEYLAGVDAAVRALAPVAGELVLDAGCGTGMSIRRYVGVGCRVVAFDLSRASLAVLRSHPSSAAGVTSVCGSLTQIPFADGTFDRVLCANALQQIEGGDVRRACVAELARVLRPGGRLVVTVHQYSLPRRARGYIKEGATGGYSGRVRYVYRFDRAELRGLLGRSVEVGRVTGAGFPLAYRYKLSPVSRVAERLLARLPAATPLGGMLVAVGTKR